jgi:putative ABC transport system substrate-binding protein
MKRRRAAIALCLGFAGLGGMPGAARAQQPGKVYRIGYLSTPTAESVARGVDAFLRKLRELGWTEGRNLAIVYRWADGDVAKLPQFAAELVRENVDLIVAPAGSAALAAKQATSTIPIVMIFASEPVELGLVADLRRPGGNVTGTTLTPGPEIFGKQLEILKEAFPRASRIAVLWNPADPSFAAQAKSVDAAASALRLRLQHVEARGPEEFEDAFRAMTRQRADALLVSASSTFLAHGAPLAELAIRSRLPTMVSFREMVSAGGLMAYAVNISDFVVHSAVYVDKILRGAKPGDLAVEQPTKFELVVNSRTAKALGIELPQSLLLRADHVVQ